MAARSVPQPPFSTDLLADLHADNVAPELSEQLWPQVRNDPEALRFLRSLDDVTSELQALGRDSRVLHAMPADVGARMDRLLDDLARGDHPERNASGEHVATVHHLPISGPPAHADDAPPATRPMPAVTGEDPPEPIRLDERRSRRLRWLTAAAAAVAIIAGSLIAVDAVRESDTTQKASPTTETGAPQLDGDSSDAVLLSALGRNDVAGPLGLPGAMTRCIAAAGLDRAVIGSMDVTFRDRPAVVILLNSARPPKITALVVGTGCGPGDAQVLEQRDIG
ncbi:hypothetical protein [Nocardia mexicana]|uniref:Anti-sigma-M factor RsmA n=1 Tax=Nocardia mexicana TaxID=279262 RepID=A0A370GXA6_9NOCA|nr:hypothetical protein [Nocardia mexicana]RDI48305.1 hypothetical protein DFR68_108134 [Nocardia mexicana]